MVRRVEAVRMARWMRSKADQEATNAFRDTSTPPILVYQMGKVGSSTVFASLKEAGVRNSILQLHFLSGDLRRLRKAHIRVGIDPPPYHIFLGEAVRRELLTRPGFPCKVISLVRDPIARVVSDLFQNPEFAAERLKTVDNTVDGKKAQSFLKQEFMKPDIFKYLNEWFDRELKEVFGIDVYSEPFSVDSGFVVYRRKNVEALIIRTESLSEEGPEAISEFLKLDGPLVLKQINVREVSEEAAVYKRVLEEFRLNRATCREIYANNKSVKHFYSKSMIEEFVSRCSESQQAGNSSR